MTFLLIACLVLLAMIVIGFAYYSKTTGDIIKIQEREISRLKREKAQLEKNRVKVENITVGMPVENIPSFKEW